MVKPVYHADKEAKETSYLFQTLNVNMQDKMYQKPKDNKLLYTFFELCKRIHWFTLLLILILGWSSYRIVMRSSLQYKGGQQALHKMRTFADNITKSKPQLEKQPKLTEVVKPREVFVSPSNETHEKPPTAKSDEKAVNDLTQRLNHMEASVKHLNLQMAALQRTARGVDSKLRRLTQTLDTLQKRQFEVPAPQAQSAPSKPTTQSEKPTLQSEMASTTPKKEEYTLHAIIPGRAWLNTSEGKIITVSVGSPLPHCGVVQGIDSTQNVVYCSTGAIIRFSTQEY